MLASDWLTNECVWGNYHKGKGISGDERGKSLLGNLAAQHCSALIKLLEENNTFLLDLVVFKDGLIRGDCEGIVVHLVSHGKECLGITGLCVLEESNHGNLIVLCRNELEKAAELPRISHLNELFHVVSGGDGLRRGTGLLLQPGDYGVGSPSSGVFLKMKDCYWSTQINAVI